MRQCRQGIRFSAYMCRDPLAALNRILIPNSLVVMAVPGKSLWPNRDERLARKLRRAGYDLILVEMGT